MRSGCTRSDAALPAPRASTARLHAAPAEPAERRTTSTSPIRPSRCRSAPRPASRSGYDAAADLAAVARRRPARGLAAATDVLMFTTDVLTAPVKISGQPIANLVASTSGTDSDWVVKLIDVYPDEVAGAPELGGYQLAVAMDIFRGRYRESFETPKAIAAGQAADSTASRSRPRTTCSCPATASWCRCSRAGSRSTTATRRRSCRTSSGPSPATTGRRRSASTTPPARRAPWSCRWCRQNRDARRKKVSKTLLEPLVSESPLSAEGTAPRLAAARRKSP